MSKLPHLGRVAGRGPKLGVGTATTSRISSAPQVMVGVGLVGVAGVGVALCAVAVSGCALSGPRVGAGEVADAASPSRCGVTLPDDDSARSSSPPMPPADPADDPAGGTPR